MYGYIYKTVNLVNGKIYIGQKKSSKFLHEDYLGSGKRLWEAISKYGKENFKVELVEEILDEKLMDEREIYWISYYNSTDKNIGYNLSTGGNVNRRLLGENNGFYGKHHTQETKDHWKLTRKYSSGKDHPGYGKERSEEVKKKISQANKGRIKTKEEIQKRLDTLNAHGGWHPSEEVKQKIVKTKREKNLFGKAKGYVHITNDIEDKMIPPEQLDEYLSLGWRKGRKKFSKIACKHISEGHKGKRAHNKDKIWISKNKETKFISKADLNIYLDQGWSEGRKS